MLILLNAIRDNKKVICKLIRNIKIDSTDINLNKGKYMQQYIKTVISICIFLDIKH